MACTSLTKGRELQCDRIAGGIKNVYFGVYDDFNANATTGEILGTGIVIASGEVTDIEMGGNDLYRYTLPRGESSLTETIVGSTENGTIHYTPQITIKLNHLSTADQNQVRILALNKLVIFAELNQLNSAGKNVILAMGVRNGMRLNSGTNLSGASFGDHNGYSWTFDGMEENPMSVVADYTTTPFDNTAFTINSVVIS
ncbi:MAG: hypothetical protein Unbinned7837contig1000_15 [Prokaryotic dsDNA virus sp.]|nr:MAG: hypothetical protein Unbinned7837contig1000_15 [Prokaryotic dsDNA virus sp.]|tara:strand:+ start:361 stop:957 length:597 start_codon:yes stop_codon:yes gene_type:complete